MYDGWSDFQLVRSAQAGESRAFAALCDRYRKRVWRIISSVARGPDVDDLAQEAVVRAWCALAGYRADACFEAWLCRIALNVAHDYQRSAWKRRVSFWQTGPEECDEASEPLEGTVSRRETQRRVRQAVASLPARQRDPIWLHYFEGFNLAEVSRLENISESTLRSRVQAGLKRLSRALRDIPESGFEASAVVKVRIESKSRGYEVCD